MKIIAFFNYFQIFSENIFEYSLNIIKLCDNITFKGWWDENECTIIRQNKKNQQITA